MNIINIGILAHVDAGKTTVTENILFTSGAIRKLGRVDSGDTQTDSMLLEKARGITIKASTISYYWKGVKVNIIDTPGHVDFVSEVERSLRVLDGAVLVISAKEGIQSHTRILYEVLKQHKIPTIFFINKLDRIGADSKIVLDGIKRELSAKVINLSKAINEGYREVVVDNILQKSEIKGNDYEVLCDYDEDILDAYINNEALSRENFIAAISKYSCNCEIHPVFMGVGIWGLGIEALLEGINNFLPVKEYEGSGEISGVVYKITRNVDQQKSAYIRLYSGTIKTRDCFYLPEKDITEKITKIQTFHNGKLLDAQFAIAGDIAVVSGLNNFQIGDFIGNPPKQLRQIELAKPTLRARVKILNDVDQVKVFNALSLLAEEDPLLDIEMDPVNKDIYIRILGEVQMEIISSILLDLHGISITFADTTTIYKEAPIAIGLADMSMGAKNNPFAASVQIQVEPLKQGEGIKYQSNVSTGYLSKSFQNAVEEAVLQSCRQGLYGWELTDILVTLKNARYDSVTSTPADFRNLTPMVFMEALSNADTQLLEPIYKFELRVPKEVGGRAINDLQTMRADILETINYEDSLLVKGNIPIDTSKNYAVKLASYTEGKGVLHMSFNKYQEIPETSKISREKTIIDPLNKRKYLLQKSNAIK